MKILVLNGSPKRDKSDTMHITRAFLDGMNDAAPQDVRIVDVIDRHIEYCRGCFACMHNGGKCVQNDDMKELLDELLRSDVILFSFPLYCYSAPAPMKAFLDRMIPLTSMAMEKSGERYVHTRQADTSHLRYVMICGCGFPNSRQNFEPAVMMFRQMFRENKTVITVTQSPMFNAPEAVEVTAPRLELVRRAGKQFAENGAIGEELLAEIGSPMIPEEIYAAICSGNA